MCTLKCSVHVFLVWVFLVCVNFANGHRHFIQYSCDPPRGGECINIWKCPSFAELLRSTVTPRSPQVVRLMRASTCGFEGKTPKVCCKITPPPLPPTTVAPKPFPAPPPPVRGVPPAPAANVVVINQNVNIYEISGHQNFHLLPHEHCGNIQYDFRITSGDQANFNEFPWMALIVYNTAGESLDFRCAGTVINEKYVLTAAHCILDSSMVGVRLGEFNIDTPDDCNADNSYCEPPVQDFYYESYVIHPEYNKKTYQNDIALIRLASPANFTYENVQPICLPYGEATTLNLDKKFTTVTGWGVTETGFRSKTMQKISIPIVPLKDCQKTYEQQLPITENQLCAGSYLGRDSCDGDSGGPLKYIVPVGPSKTPRYFQYGIVSYGPKICGTDGQPGIYTNVKSYLKWILDNLKP